MPHLSNGRARSPSAPTDTVADDPNELTKIMATSDSTQTNRCIDARVTIGHVHLKVSDLERSLAFYCGVLGFELMQRMGTQAAFISAGGYHHHIGLNTW